MPNVRKKGKKHVAAWLTEEEWLMLKREAAKRGQTQTDFLREKIYEAANRKYDAHKAKK